MSLDGSGRRDGLLIAYEQPIDALPTLALFDISKKPPKLLARARGIDLHKVADPHDFNHDRVDEFVVWGYPGNRSTPTSIWRFDGRHLRLMLDDIPDGEFIDFDEDGVDEVLVQSYPSPWRIYKLRGSRFVPWRDLDFFDSLQFNRRAELEFEGHTRRGVMTLVNKTYDVDPAPPVEIELNGDCVAIPPQREVRIPVTLKTKNVLHYAVPRDIMYWVTIEPR